MSRKGTPVLLTDVYTGSVVKILPTVNAAVRYTGLTSDRIKHYIETGSPYREMEVYIDLLFTDED